MCISFPQAKRVFINFYIIPITKTVSETVHVWNNIVREGQLSYQMSFYVSIFLYIFNTKNAFYTSKMFRSFVLVKIFILHNKMVLKCKEAL